MIEKRKRKGGTTAYRVKVERGGVQFSQTYSVYEDALRAQREMLRRLETRGLSVESAKLTFADCVRHFRSGPATELAPTTASRYETVIKKYLLPRFGNTLVARLRAKDILEVMNEIQKDEGWSNASYNSLTTVFQSIWTSSYRAELFEVDQLRGRLKRKTPAETERYVPHPRELAGMLERLRVFSAADPSKRWAYVMSVLLATFALRRAEAASIRICDIDFENQKLRIAHAICPKTGELRQTKTGASDFPPIPARVLEILKEYLMTLPEGAVYLFHSPDDPTRPRDLRGITRRLKYYYNECGLPLMLPKTMRAFSCSTTPTVGASQAEAMSLSRHRTAGVFLKHYHRARDDRRLDILERTVGTFLPDHATQQPPESLPQPAPVEV